MRVNACTTTTLKQEENIKAELVEDRAIARELRLLKYVDFVNLKYKPLETDLICTFYVEPDGVDLMEAAGGIAAESSIGTWTELTTSKAYVDKLAARVFSLKENEAKIAYHNELFEGGNMPNILSSIAGNVFGLKTIRNLKLLDVELPSILTKTFKGPKYGIKGVRQLLNVHERPLIGTIIKPKLGLKSSDHARVAYEAWVGGCDMVKDDENLSSQKFNPFEERVAKTMESRDRAQSETGERKVYMANITAETNTVLERAEFVLAQGGEYVMLDILTCGLSALQTLRNLDLPVVIHAHRAGHAAFTKNPKHGISMRPIAKIARAIGVDQIHIGTVVGKMSETRQEVLDNVDALKMPMHGIKEVFPVASGGLHPRLIPALVATFGNDVVIQAGGGIHGHESGTIAGARAMRQAVDATLKGQSLEEYAKNHEELRISLEMWKN